VLKVAAAAAAKCITRLLKSCHHHHHLMVLGALHTVRQPTWEVFPDNRQNKTNALLCAFIPLTHHMSVFLKIFSPNQLKQIFQQQSIFGWEKDLQNTLFYWESASNF